MSTVTTYAVRGMTCEHCVAAVTTELLAVPGTTAVSVDLDDGTVRLTSEAEVDLAVVRAAIDEAGYELAGDAP